MSHPDSGPNYDVWSLKPDAIYPLLMVLGAHLSGSELLSDNELLSVKAMLVEYAEDCESGNLITLEENGGTDGGCAEDVWIAVGRLPNDETVVWHKTLPWPTALNEFYSR